MIFIFGNKLNISAFLYDFNINKNINDIISAIKIPI